MPPRAQNSRGSESNPQRITNLAGLLTRVRDAGKSDETVSLEDLRGHLGRRAFGPLLAIAALPSLTPIATVPLLPTALSIIIVLTSVQMLIGMRRIWLPQRLLRQSFNRARLNRVVDAAMPIARFVDRLIRPRLVFLTREPSVYVIGTLCCLLALMMPPLELVPFTGGIPALPVLLFGLAMTARDGALVLVAFALTGAGALGLAYLGMQLL